MAERGTGRSVGRVLRMGVAALAAAAGLVVVVLGAVLVPAFLGNAPLEAAPVQGLGEIVLDGYVSVAIMDLGDGTFALVDAGNSPDGAPILAALAARGAGPADVAAIALTHGHPDHVAACHLFPGAKTFLLAPEAPYARGERRYHGALPRLFPPVVSGCAQLVPVEDGFTATWGKHRVEVFGVPGHTAGSAVWLIDDVAFLGDVARVRSDRSIEGAPWFFSDDPDQNARELRELARRIADRPLREAHNSHTGPVTGEELKAHAAR